MKTNLSVSIFFTSLFVAGNILESVGVSDTFINVYTI